MAEPAWDFYGARKLYWLFCSLAAVSFVSSSPSYNVFRGGVKSLVYREAFAKRPYDVMMTKRSDDVDSLEQVMQQQASVIQTMQAQLTALTNDVADLKTKAGKAVAFSVKFSADPIANVGVGSTLKFDRVVHNLGGSYDTQTGIFTAPTPGTYAFFLGLMGSDTQGAVELAIIRSGAVLDLAWAEGKSDLYDQGSCLVTTQLTAGQQVWVKHLAGATELRGGSYTHFSGFLVHADA